MNALTAEATRATLTLGDERTARQIADTLAEMLDDDETAVATFENPGKGWDVIIHFAQVPDEATIRDLVSMAADDDVAAAMVLDKVVARDWVKESLEGLKPVQAGRFIVHGAHDRDRVPDNAIGIEIEAALAFGTGHHGTTRGCLVLLDEVLRAKRPRRILDLGTGTGVLGIAAGKALRQRVLASDIDRQAAITARDNARLNGAGNLLEAICCAGFGAPQFRSYGPFDLVLANILANPLKRLAKPMSGHLAPGASVILSGLLPPHANGVISAYRPWLKLTRRIELEGWTSLLMTRG